MLATGLGLLVTAGAGLIGLALKVLGHPDHRDILAADEVERGCEPSPRRHGRHRASP